MDFTFPCSAFAYYSWLCAQESILVEPKGLYTVLGIEWD